MVYLSLRACWKTNKRRAIALLKKWEQIPYPIFKRLALDAYADFEELGDDNALELMLDPKGVWLWSISTQPEVLRFLRKSAHRLTTSQLGRLINAILEGPPRYLYRADIADEKYEEIRDTSIWERLAFLQRHGAELPPKVAVQLKSLGDKTGRRLQKDPRRDELVTWSEGGWGADFLKERIASTAQLQELTNTEIVDILINPNEAQIEQFRSFGSFCAEAPDRGIAIIKDSRLDESIRSLVWAAAYEGFAGIEDAKHKRDHFGKFATELLDATKCGLITSDISFARWLRRQANDIDLADEIVYLELWESLFAAAVERENPMDHTDLSAAINHPAGVLAEALLASMWSHKPKGGSALPPTLVNCFDLITSGHTVAHWLAQTFLTSQLSNLFLIDRPWTESNLIPLLSWSNPERAKCIWQGYLWSPRIFPDLAKAIKQSLFEATKRIDELGDRWRLIPQLLILIWLRSDTVFSSTEVRSIIREMPETGLNEILRKLKQLLEGAAEKRSALWRNEVGPWFRQYWKIERERLTDAISCSLAALAFQAGQSFPDVVKTVLPFIKPSRELNSLLYRFRKDADDLGQKNLASTYPSAMLTLLDKLVHGGAPSYNLYGLREAINLILSTKQELSREPEMRRLQGLAARSM